MKNIETALTMLKVVIVVLLLFLAVEGYHIIERHYRMSAIMDAVQMQVEQCRIDMDADGELICD